MKKFTFIILLSLCYLAGFSQNARFVVFTENGDRFFLYMNGKLQNAGLQSNVTTKNILAEGVTLRVVFDDKTLGEKQFKMPVKAGYEVTCALKKNNKGEYVIRYAGEAVLEDDSQADSYQTPNNANTSSSQPPANTQPVNQNGNQEQVDININMGGAGMGTSTNVKYTTQVTSTSTSSSSGNTSAQPQTQTAAPKESACPPMSTTDFAEAKKSVADKGFEETRITEAKQILDANCMTTKQIKDLIQVFGFEESKLDVAKYAYKKCSDPKNYYQINSAFGFETSVESLNAYIKSVK